MLVWHCLSNNRLMHFICIAIALLASKGFSSIQTWRQRPSGTSTRRRRPMDGLPMAISISITIQLNIELDSTWFSNKSR